jgi:hypothetical protein
VRGYDQTKRTGSQETTILSTGRESINVYAGISGKSSITEGRIGMTDIDDKSLLRCTIKKSADVLNKVVLYGSYVIAAITAIVIGTAIVYFGITKLWEPLINAISTIISFLFGIPELFWALPLVMKLIILGIVSLGVIGVYSLVWCIARDLEKEDWESDSAKDIALAAFALTLAFAFAALAFAALAFALTLAALAFALALANPKIFLVIGAYLHYRKRTRETAGR